MNVAKVRGRSLEKVKTIAPEATLQQAADMGFVCDEPALEDFVRNYVDRAQD